MIFIGMIWAFVFLIIIAIVVIATIILSAGFFGTGLVTFIVEKKKGKSAEKKGIPRKKKAYPVILMIIGIAIITPLAIYSLVSPDLSAYIINESYRELRFCIDTDSYEQAKILIDEGKASVDCTYDSNEKATEYEVTLLMHFCRLGNDDDKNIEKIKFLIENGADVNHRVYHEDGHYESDDDMFHGFNYGCDCGRTALIYAVNGGHVETVKLLIENGADVNVRDCSDMNLLMYLYNTNIYAYTPSPTDEEIIAIAELLIENGVDVNAIDESGQTVLDYAKKEEYDNYGLIELLVNNGALTSGQIEEQKAENTETEDYTEFSDDSFGEYEE
ncbi:MAG: ankyrin repeat domain-containing protein [Oscillospiraceae bacterium]|nr:ankyrin repeat domain-containing protein [Oscillospiraceae bacterium]